MASTISEQAYQSIKERILSGSLAPGTYLVEQDLASSLGVSRTPVKGALRRLEVEGLIESEGYKRSRVRKFDIEQTQEVLELRALLESHACKRAAGRISDEQLQQLQRLATAMEVIAEQPLSTTNLQEFSRLNDEFHRLILDVADSPLLNSLMQPIFQMHILLTGRYQQRMEGNLKRSCWHHREIIAALSDRNPDWAGMQMQTHLYAASSWKPDTENGESNDA